MNNNIDRIGEISLTTKNEKMIIIEYFGVRNVSVRFNDGTIVKNKTYKSFKKGNISNPNRKSIFNIGYIGEGEYLTRENNKMLKKYKTWSHMLERCYNEHSYEKQNSYKDCYVCDEWHNYQNFAKWYDENYYKIEGEEMCLDKDILIKNNKIYSPNTCMFVPKRINSLFIKHKSRRGDCLIGVTYCKKTNKYRAQYTQNTKLIYLQEYDDMNEAFESYKKSKEKYIKQVAEEYKDKIPKKLYDAMYRYEVDITD